MFRTAANRKISLSDTDLKSLNKRYRTLTPPQRISRLYSDFELEDIMLTSSFAASSALFLKLFSEINKEQVVYFIDTGYHFDDTLDYVEHLSNLYGLRVRSIKALREEHEFTKNDQTWLKNPDFCCHINKVKPLDIIKKNYLVWASGLMSWQSDHRATLDIFERRGEIVKFYPLLDVSKSERDKWIEKWDLPFHPLKAKGYNSIGCVQCTIPGDDRTGRWNNNPKTECGLHL